MAANDRNEPKRAKSSDSDLTLVEFWREYPDDAACLDKLWRERYAPDGHHAHCPVCDRERKFHRIKSRASYACDSCGKHLHPMKGTIFEKSTTSLQLWFYAMFLMASTRCGISAKQLERELGVTYKTAWRMFNKIRNELMNDEDEGQLEGKVEVDETSWGGKPRNKLKGKKAAAQFRETKTTVLGMVEREGRVRLRVIASRRGEPLSSPVRTHVNPAAFLLTDDWIAYRPLRREYDWATINHSAGVYVEGDIHTNRLRAFSATSRPACAASTSTSRTVGFSPTWMSMRGATTLGGSPGGSSSSYSGGLFRGEPCRGPSGFANWHF